MAKTAHRRARSRNRAGNRNTPGVLPGQTATHGCPGRCGEQVPPRRFACTPCWYLLPVHLRESIRRTFRRDDAAHLHALVNAVRWYEEQSGAVSGASRVG